MMTWTAITGGVFEFGTFATALSRGGRPERVVATGILIEYAVTPLVQDSHHLEGVQYGPFILDVLMLMVVLFETANSDRRWLLFGSAFQILAVLMHLAAMTGGQYDAWSTITMTIILGYGLTGSLLVGALTASPHQALKQQTSEGK
jgi:hypothetical protein